MVSSFVCTDIPGIMPESLNGFVPSPTLSPFPDSASPVCPPRIVQSPCAEAHFPFSDTLFPEKNPTIALIKEKGKAETTTGLPKHCVADIFREQEENLLNSGKLSPEQAKAVYSIINCRTETYGYHAEVCDECGFIDIGYNSCRNRHCPRCQGIAKRKWVNARLSELLPVAYHHVVFTVPAYISMLSMYNQKMIYDLLFKAASQTLLAFGKDAKFLGANIGFYGILHTWSQTLGPHIHIHFIVTAGGLTGAGQWKEPKHARKFLFPVRAVSKVFRGKFIEGFKGLYYDHKLTIPDRMGELNTAEGFEKRLNILVSKSWRVYSKPPFSGPDEVVRYIGRYTHRIAISDGRIISFKDGKVTFSYKDNREKEPDRKYKEMTLTTEEFIRRFLYHVLPQRYHRIRNYGFLSNGRKKQNIEIIRRQLPDACEIEMAEAEEGMICPICGKGKMKTFLIVNGNGQIIESDFTAIKGEYGDTS